MKQPLSTLQDWHLLRLEETFSEHLAGIGDAPHAHEPLAAHAHVSEVPVLSGPHVHHLASELGLLVHQPVTVHHVAGLALVHAVTSMMLSQSSIIS
ncbi:hypothetical protein F7725_002407 [Dissostichus mawsoni]|uniref:Uncharacterized protein n=1 Tax=Dissostichus mawsoni TaxID=36200 RepID=A0A7J5Y5G2_DISMA|nr:hypothetical protein F7725_002407 [Dissostichus mawsoni]